MAEPLSLKTIESEFTEETEAWTLRDEKNLRYLIIPHPSYPNRHPIHFFFNQNAAQDILTEILDVNEKLRNEDIFPVKIKLLTTLREIASEKTNGDGFVVHSPNEVYEFLRDRDWDDILS